MLGRKLSLWIGLILIIAMAGWNRLGTVTEPENLVLPRDPKRAPALLTARTEPRSPTVQVSGTDILVSSSSSRIEDLPDEESPPLAAPPADEQVSQALQFAEANDHPIIPDQNWGREPASEDGAFQTNYVGPDGTQIKQWYRSGEELSIQETTFADQSKFTTWLSHETDDGPQKLVEYHSGNQGWQISYVNGYPKRIRFWNGDAPESIHDF